MICLISIKIFIRFYISGTKLLGLMSYDIDLRSMDMDTDADIDTDTAI